MAVVNYTNGGSAANALANFARPYGITPSERLQTEQLPMSVLANLLAGNLIVPNDGGAVINVKDPRYGAVGDGVTDDTAAIQAALDACYDAGGGIVFIPTGTYRVTTIVKNWTSGIAVQILGAGTMATVLQKIGAGTAPILDFSANVGVLTTYCTIANLRVRGNAKTHHGIRLTLWARFRLDRVRIDTCDVALELRGSLVFDAFQCTIVSNNIGVRTRVNSGIPCNLIQFFGGQMSGNTSFGCDIGDSDGFHFYGTDMSANGTSGDTATGALVIRDTVDNTAGVARGSFTNCWFEGNDGMCIRVEAATNLVLAFATCQFIASESGNVMDCGAIRTLSLDNCIAASLGDTITVAPANFIARGGTIAIIVDNSTSSSSVFGVATQTAGVGNRGRTITPLIGASTSYANAPSVPYSNADAVGNVGGGEDDLKSYTLPANALSAGGKGVRITAFGTTANNVNAKTIRLYFGGTLIGSLALTTGQANAWRADGEVIFSSTTTARAIMQIVQGGTVAQTDCESTTVTVTTSNANIIKITGEGVADNDIVARALIVEFIN